MIVDSSEGERAGILQEAVLLFYYYKLLERKDLNACSERCTCNLLV